MDRAEPIDREWLLKAKEAIERMLTKEEVEQVISAVKAGHHNATEDDFKIALVWARRVRLDYGLLHGVLTGRLALSIEDGELAFHLEQGKAVQ